MRNLALLLGLALGAASYGDISDEFESYLNEVIPMTHRIAENHSYVMEYAIAVDRASLAQSHLAAASRDGVLLQQTLSELELGNLSELGSIPATPPNFERSLRQIFAASQIRNLNDRLKLRLRAFDAIRKGIGEGCANDDNFSRYHIEDLEFKFRIPEVELFDGVYVVYAKGTSRSNSSGSNGGSGGNQNGGGFEQIPLLGSLYQIGKNISEQSKLRGLVERLNREIPTTDHYRKYAKTNCSKIADIQKAAFRNYDKLYDSLSELSSKIPDALLQKLVAFHRAQIAAYENGYREHLKSQAESIARALSDRRERPPELTALLIASNERLNLALLRLSRAACGAGLEAIQKIRAERGLRKLYRFSADDLLLKRAETALEERRTRCGGDEQ